MWERFKIRVLPDMLTLYDQYTNKHLQKRTDDNMSLRQGIIFCENAEGLLLMQSQNAFN